VCSSDLTTNSCGTEISRVNGATANHCVGLDLVTTNQCGQDIARQPSGCFSQIALNRFYSPAALNHWVTTGVPDPNLYYQEGWSAGISQGGAFAGAVPVYSCFAGGDQMISTSGGCEGYGNQGLLGYASSVQYPGFVPVYRCYASAPGRLDHVLSWDPNCEGLTPDGFIFYARQLQ
jgi:hypothetical protein